MSWQDVRGVHCPGGRGNERGKEEFKRCEQRPGDKWVWRGSRMAGSLAWIGDSKCSQAP